MASGGKKEKKALQALLSLFQSWREEMRLIAPQLEIETSQLSQTLPQQPNHMMDREFQGGHVNLDPTPLSELKEPSIVTQVSGTTPESLDQSRLAIHRTCKEMSFFFT